MGIYIFNQNVMYLLNALLVIQAMVAGLILIYKSTPKRPSFYLALFFLVFSISELLHLMYTGEYLEESSMLIFAPISFIFLAFPLLFLYVKGLFTTLHFKKIRLHLIPGMLELFIFLILAIYFSPEERLKLLNTKGHMIGREVYFFSAWVCQIYYVIRIIKLLNRNKEELNDYFSNLIGRSIWLRYVAFGYLIFGAVNLMFSTFYILHVLGYTWVPKYYIPTLFVFLTVLELTLIYTATTFALKQQYCIRLSKITLNPKNQKKINPNPKSTTDDDQKDLEIYTNLLRLVEDTKCFKNPDLTIATLADTLGVHHRKLSQIINLKAKCNFNSFINKYRVEEAKEIMSQPELARKLTLEVLGAEVGFKSRSSLYSAFTKFEGRTPGEFMNNF